jgi:hypothetical protein
MYESMKVVALYKVCSMYRYWIPLRYIDYRLRYVRLQALDRLLGKVHVLPDNYGVLQ